MHLMVNTGGGDAPGLNAVIRAVVLSAIRRGWRVTGIRHGYEGLLSGDPEGLVQLDAKAVRGITFLGGSILGTINKGNPFEYPLAQDGKTVLADISEKVVARFREVGADALIAVGGDGSMRIAQRFFEKGIPLVGVPKTIDNDLNCTDYTFGFDTAVATATDAIDKLHSTAEAHRRVMVVELMGRYVGWIALQAGLAGTADVILIPEIPFEMAKVCAKIKQREAAGRHFAIVVVAEGALAKGGSLSIAQHELGREQRLGGLADKVAQAIEAGTGKECRSIVLGHLQRGGGPSAFDRALSLRLGAAAVRLVADGAFGQMAALQGTRLTSVPIVDTIRTMKTVPLDCDMVQAARDLGICLGD
jgi:ATP-dependent phosphofructokinase / diphosphate-dependent phosphofructokinase